MPFISKKKYTKKPMYKAKPKYKRRSGVSSAAVKAIVQKTITKTLEKKKINLTVFSQGIGQIATDGPGYLSLDITPSPTLGTGHSNRVGSKVSMTGIHVTTQMIEQGANSSIQSQFIYQIILQKNVCSDDVYTTGDSANPIEKMFNANAFIRTSVGAEAGVIDYSSERNQANFKNFQVLRTGKIYMKPDQIATTTNRIRTKTLGVKFKKPFVLTYDTNSDSIHHRVILLIRSSAGNSGLISTLTAVPTTVANSGFLFSMEANSYYVDA